MLSALLISVSLLHSWFEIDTKIHTLFLYRTLGSGIELKTVKEDIQLSTF